MFDSFIIIIAINVGSIDGTVLILASTLTEHMILKVQIISKNQQIYLNLLIILVVEQMFDRF